MLNIFYINMDKNTDRNDFMIQQLNKYDYKINRIAGIDGLKLKDFDYRNKISSMLNIDTAYLVEPWLKCRSNFKTMSSNIDYILPRFGLYLSTIKLIKTAIMNGLNSCVILEDDAIIKNEIKIPNIDADLIYLGATFKGDRYAEGELICVDPKKIVLFGTFGYYVNNCQAFLKVLEAPFQGGRSFDKHVLWRSGNIKLRCQNIDSFIKNHYQMNGTVYFVNPQTISHPTKNISTINTKQYNYSNNNLRFEY